MVVDELLEKIEDEDLAIHVVWTPVLSPDNREAALAARSYIQDSRAKHYWDGTQSLGLAFGKTVALPNGRELAWDIYFAFERGKTWGKNLPDPDEWVHQLGRDDKHLGDGSGFRTKVQKLLISAKSSAKRSDAQAPGGDRDVVTINVGGMKKSRGGAT